MSSSYTVTEAVTFTITHARHIASKVATDLKRVQRFYGVPSDERIAEYEAELTSFVKAGYLAAVTYGFKRDDAWIEPTLRYTAQDLFGGTGTDDDPGRIRPGGNTAGATFYSYLEHNSAWSRLSQAERDAFEIQLPIRRGGAPQPTVSGYMQVDRTYSAGGRSLQRSTVRSW